jgi:hypothetical protein
LVKDKEQKANSASDNSLAKKAQQDVTKPRGWGKLNNVEADQIALAKREFGV